MLNSDAGRTGLALKSARSSAYLPILIFGLILVAVVTAVVLSGNGGPKPKSQNLAKVSACGAYRTNKVVQIGTQKINAEVATTPDERDKGLGGRPCILPNQGMLFVFDKPDRYPMWMKDMKFPIDIIWITSNYKVAGVEIDVQPSTYPDSFVNKDTPAQYVLEIGANRSKDLHIEIGTPVNF